jgi:hypothetical protein
MRVTTEGYKYGKIEFDSWGEFIDQGCKPSANPNRSESERSSRSSDSSWTGTKTFNDAVKLARDGWAEGEAIVQSMSASITNKVTDLVEREHVTYDVEGIGLDVAAYVNGEPECWQRFETDTTESIGTKHVRLVFNCSVSGSVSTDTILAKGAAVVSLVQALEFAGIRVEVTALARCGTNNYGSGRHEIRVPVKAADQDLDMGRITFALAHPSMIRRMGFAVTESTPESCKVMAIRPGTTDDEGDIYVDSSRYSDSQWRSSETATQWILDRLKEQGIHLVTETK